MVTPEMLLFLAGKMGVAGHIALNRVWIKPDMAHSFSPHVSDADFGLLVVWAWQEGIVVDNQGCSILTEYDGGPTFIVDHDSTPDSIRAAAVVAVCRALGWGEKK